MADFTPRPAFLFYILAKRPYGESSVSSNKCRGLRPAAVFPKLRLDLTKPDKVVA